MIESLDEIAAEAQSRAEQADSKQTLALLRSEILGKKGRLGAVLRQVGSLPADERRKAGQRLNEIKTVIQDSLRAAHERLDMAQKEATVAASAFDVTLPGRRVVPGCPHPLRLVEEDVIACMRELGFRIAEGPQVEHEWYNFEALNIPEDHPARDMQDTFFVAPRVVLRTHTSSVQIRTMLKREPPVRILAPGMVFRHDEVDPTHSPVFHQIEGLWVDHQVTFGDLKGILQQLVTYLFGDDVKIRFRPSFFPFTEPSAEVDVSCVVCAHKASSSQEPCRVCRGTGWLEILGAGMVDPKVLEAVGYDSEKLTGLAFGLGVERIAMLRWGVDDIRLFYENDLRFLDLFAPGR